MPVVEILSTNLMHQIPFRFQNSFEYIYFTICVSNYVFLCHQPQAISHLGSAVSLNVI